MNLETSKTQEMSYFTERYSEAIGKLTTRVFHEFDYKPLARNFHVKTISRYDEERFQSFCSQFTEYYKNALQTEIEKLRRKYRVNEMLEDIFEQRLNYDILEDINSSELQKELPEIQSAYDIEKLVFECIKDQLVELKTKNVL